jgi:hypothetical protein
MKGMSVQVWSPGEEPIDGPGVSSDVGHQGGGEGCGVYI